MLIVRWLILNLLIRPFIWLFIGLNTGGRARLPLKGPAILVANHKSHLDTLIILSLLSARLRVHPVGSPAFSGGKKFVPWVMNAIFGLIADDPKCNKAGSHTHHPSLKALDQGHLLLIYPEGKKGGSAQISALQEIACELSGVRPDIPVFPILIDASGKNLSKGEARLVPYMCDLFVGSALYTTGTRLEFMKAFQAAFDHLASLRNK